MPLFPLHPAAVDTSLLSPRRSTGPQGGFTRRGRSARDGLGARVATALADDTGAATAEYAVTIMAAVGFAGLLVAILRSGEVRAALAELVTRALNVGG